MRNILLFILFVVFTGYLGAQDIHYSQFYNSPLNVNPAKTGIFNGDKRVNLSYRSQWSSVPVPWTTFSGSFDRKWYPKHGKKHFFSGGVLLNHDRNGEGTILSLTNINLTGSWTKIINEQNLFTVGALLGYATRGLDRTTLTWDNQWNGSSADFSLPSLEPESIDAAGVNFLQNGLGINYRWQKTRRTKLDLGVGIYHVIQPNASLFDSQGGVNEVKLPSRYSLTGVGSFQLTQKFDIQLDVLAQFQGNYNELILGALGKIHINQRRGKEAELHIGGGWRTSGDLFPVVAIQFKNFYVSANYDVNISEFNDAFIDNGLPGIPTEHDRPTSFELHFTYIITDVKPFDKVKVCPIF